MTTKIAQILNQKSSLTSTESPTPTSGLGEAALEIQKTTQQVAQQHAPAPLTQRPSLNGRATLLSSSTSEEELLLKPPSKRENRSQALSLAPGSDERVPAAAQPVVPFKSSLWGGGSGSDSAQNSANNSFEAVASEDAAADLDLSFSIEAAMSSKENSPIKANGKHVPAGTPSPIKDVKKIIQKNDPTCELMPKDNTRLQRGVDCLNNLTSPQHSTQVAAVRTLMASALAQTSPVATIAPKNPTQRKLLFAMDSAKVDEKSWVPAALESTQTFLLDRNHLLKFNGAGKHICPAGDPDDAKILNRYTHVKTGIWCGTIADGKKGEKFSSLIPRSMTEQDYLTHIAGALSNKEQLIAKGGNKALFMLPTEGHPLCVEIYTEHNGHKVKSAFPIFHYEEYAEKSTTLKIEMSYQASMNAPITQVLIEIPYEAILKEAKSLKKNDEAIEFETKTHWIVDVALLFNSDRALCPLSRGILVSIPKKYLK